MERQEKRDQNMSNVSKLEPLFQDLNVDDMESQITEITSLCLRCHENGITKLLLTKIPFYKDVVVMSFTCPHCNWENNELQPAAAIQEKGILFDLRITHPKDLNREIVKTEWASVVIPEIEFEIPSKSQEGIITSIEGIIQRAIDGLEIKLKEFMASFESTVILQEFLEKLKDLKNVNSPFHFVLRDPSGNSFLENIYAPKSDPEMEVIHFERSRDECLMLGIICPDEEDDKELVNENEEKILKNEVLEFSTNCHYCNAPCITNMKVIEIPHFKNVVVMVTICDTCSQKTNEVQSSSGIEPYGIKISLALDDESDLKRDVLKSDTCRINIPELELDIGSSAISGCYTTVEGLITNIKESLQRNPFVMGDSAGSDTKNKMKLFLKKLDDILEMKQKITLILDDPCGHSYMQSLNYPESDSKLTIEKYERTFEQNEELGLNDMKVENYEET